MPCTFYCRFRYTYCSSLVRLNGELPSCRVSVGSHISSQPTFTSRVIGIGRSRAGIQGRGKREIPEKTRRPVASSGTIPTCENLLRESNPLRPWEKRGGMGMTHQGVIPDDPAGLPVLRRGGAELVAAPGHPEAAFWGAVILQHTPANRVPIPGEVTPGFQLVGIVRDDNANRRVSSGITRFPHPCIPQPPKSLHSTHAWAQLVALVREYPGQPPKKTCMDYTRQGFRKVGSDREWSVEQWPLDGRGGCRTVKAVGSARGADVGTASRVSTLAAVVLTGQGERPVCGGAPPNTRDTATRIKSPIAAKRKALNWRAVFSSHCVCLWDFQRRPYYFNDEKHRNGRSPRKPADERHRPVRFPRAKNPEVTPPVIEPGSPSWEASSLTTTSPRPRMCAERKTRAEVSNSNARLHHRGSKLDQRSNLRSTQKTVAPLEFRAGLEIEMKFISNRRNWRFEISTRDQQPSLINIDESEVPNHDISLVQHFYIGIKIKLDPATELGSFDLGSGKMLVQPGITRIGAGRGQRRVHLLSATPAQKSKLTSRNGPKGGDRNHYGSSSKTADNLSRSHFSQLVRFRRWLSYLYLSAHVSSASSSEQAPSASRNSDEYTSNHANKYSHRTCGMEVWDQPRLELAVQAGKHEPINHNVTDPNPQPSAASMSNGSQVVHLSIIRNGVTVRLRFACLLPSAMAAPHSATSAKHQSPCFPALSGRPCENDVFVVTTPVSDILCSLSKQGTTFQRRVGDGY
ncbi:hypothetical protein PR048_003266 [Dryococelus australis]|uniref:Uncharacterized protein n=1 Tax=Dryococelus australis TaxID=614101 RepID=A0ABQ9INW9_9NEOP|nr:hypothetical protein PR048_003266 [Dryococelus australis]